MLIIYNIVMKVVLFFYYLYNKKERKRKKERKHFVNFYDLTLDDRYFTIVNHIILRTLIYEKSLFSNLVALFSLLAS